MKWIPKRGPREGDVRVVKRFAWWPVETGDGFVVWLESYHDHQRYVVCDGHGGRFEGWDTFKRRALRRGL